MHPSASRLDPFAIVRYRWIVRGAKSAVRVEAEAEVAETENDLPQAAREDILAALATLELEQ